MSERAGTSARRARRRRTRRVVVAGTAVALVAVGGVGYASTRGPDERYRTATAEEASVAQTVTGTGTVASAARADVAFQVAGTVATVDVAVGDTVAAGDVLAALDPASLQEALEQAESALADAEQELEDDLESQTAASTATTATTSTGTTGAGTTPGVTTETPSGSESPAATAAVAAVTRAQQELLAQAEAASAALAIARTSLAAGRTSCGEPVDPTPPGSTPTPTPSPTTEPATEPATDPATDPEALAACRAALDQALADQETVETAQARLGELARALDAAVSGAQRALASAGSASSGGTGSTGTSTGTQTSTGAPSGTPGSAEAATAEELLADQAEIELARARVAVAQAELSMAALTSPITGRVGAIALAPGDQVGAASDTAVVTVLGDGGHVVELTVGLAVVDTVEAGQPAEVTVASTDEVLAGTVGSVGVLDVSDSGDPEYTAVVTLDPTDAPLFDGAAAQVRITVGTGDATLTVPTSAVRTTGGLTTVAVLSDADAVEVEVEVGAVGAERTEILSGLSAGDVVVLADLAAPVTQDDDGSTGSGLTGLTDTDETSLPQAPTGGGPGMPPEGMTGQG